MNHMTKTSLTLLALLAPLSLWAADKPSADKSGLSFQRNDWQIACDNTRTCRAAGYQLEDAGEVEPVSVLLTRKAGPREPVTGELTLGTADDNLAKLKQPLRLTMRVNGKALGQVPFAKDSAVAPLSAEQVAALLAALPRSATVEWRAGDMRWRLSDKGASAVLLKMDEFQGRLNTPGALVRKGSGDEAQVLPAVPAPVVRLSKPLGTTKNGVPRGLYEAMRATVAKSDDCNSFDEGETKAEDVALVQLNTTQWLASAKCWLAAYNGGSGYWVVQLSPPYKPALVTTMGTDYEAGRIHASHKGRGIGDCWSNDEWAWDGSRFVQTLVSTTGLCRLVAAGGAWTLPTLVTEVK